jgi:hypothetical protein
MKTAHFQHETWLFPLFSRLFASFKRPFTGLLDESKSNVCRSLIKKKLLFTGLCKSACFFAPSKTLLSLDIKKIVKRVKMVECGKQEAYSVSSCGSPILRR